MFGSVQTISESQPKRRSCDMAVVTPRSIYESLEAIKPDDISFGAWAKRAQVSRSWFGDVRKGVVPRDRTLEKVLAVIGYTLPMFLNLIDDRRRRTENVIIEAAPALPFRGGGETIDVPLVGTAQGSAMEVSEDGEVSFVEQMDLDLSETIDYLRRPPALASRRDVYAITVVGDSMNPKWEEGDPLYIDPKRQPHAGDYVVVQLKHPGDEEQEGRLRIALLKRLVRRTSDRIELCQLNPSVSFSIPVCEVHAVHRVIPWREMVFF